MIFFKILSVLLKVVILYVFFFDYTKTKRLLEENKAVRDLTWYQQAEVVFFFFASILQIFIPLTVVKAYYSTLIHFVLLIATYIHLNRWIFLSRHILICRCEVFKIDRVRPTYNKGIVRFKSGNRQFAIHHPLATKALLKKYL